MRTAFVWLQSFTDIPYKQQIAQLVNTYVPIQKSSQIKAKPLNTCFYHFRHSPKESFRH